MPAPRALALGMIDALAEEGRLREDAIAFAKRFLAENRPLQRVRDRNDKVEAARGHPEIFDSFLARHAQAFRGLKAPANIVKAVEAAGGAGELRRGLAARARIVVEMWQSTEAAADVLFFRRAWTAKVPDVPPTLPRCRSRPSAWPRPARRRRHRA